MTDKRKFERFGITVPAKMVVTTPDGAIATFQVETNNLSAGGTFFKLSDPLPEGSVVKIEIALAFDELKTQTDPRGSLILETTGHVLRADAEGVAIRFDENFEFKARLDSLNQIVRKKPFKGTVS